MPEPETSMTDAVAGSGGAKKKRNRKKKSRKRNASTNDSKSAGSNIAMVAASTSAGQQQLSAESKMNLHAVLRHRIQEEGFTTAQIDQAMEEMWNKGLAYDEYEAVLKHLKGEKDEEEKTDSRTDDWSRDSESGEGESTSPRGTGTRTNGCQIVSSGTQKAKPTISMTMEQKLELVANFENMTDAIFALTEWIRKAAKPEDLEDLCAATKIPVLITILRRSITECKEQSNFDKAVMPSIARLVSSLLQKSGIPSARVEETQNTFEILLRQARRVFFMQQENAENFSNCVSKFIVSRVSLAIEEFKIANAKIIDANEKSFVSSTSIQAAAVTDNSGFADLLSSRDINLTATKRYGAMTCSAFAMLVTKDRISRRGNGSSRETEVGHSDIMLALVGEDAKADMELQKANLEELKAKVKEGETESMQDLRVSIEELHSERETIKLRILELKQSIDKLETYDAELCVKVDEAQIQLDSEIALASAESNNLNEEIKEASEKVKYGVSLSGLATSLKKYDDSLNRAINAATKIPGVDASRHALKQMDVFVTRARTYFQFEADTIEFLRNRKTTCQMEANELEMEVIEMQGLGLETTIGQLKIMAEEKRDLIEKDSVMIERFVGEANTVFDSLVARVEDYETVQESHAFKPVQRDVLGEIVSYALRIGISFTQRLHPSRKSMNGHSEVSSSNLASDDSDEPILPTLVAGSVDASAALASNEKEMTSETKSSSVATSPTVPKLTWAAAKSNGKAQPKTSFLDIQKEEMRSKER